MKKFLKSLVLSVSAVALSYQTATAAPLFPDVPSDHWGADAVAALSAKGLLEGYPDGTFKGDRSASRWEVAMIVARLLARMEQDHSKFATKADLDQIRTIAESYREELEAFGVRVDNLEELATQLDARVSDLERIRFYGRLHSVFVSNNVKGSVPSLGTGANPGIDWSSGRLLTDGTGFTSLGILGLNADITEDIVAGAEFVGYASQGDAVVDAYWGVSAPYQANPWTAQGSNAPGLQSDNHTPFTRVLLDNFWVHHKPTDTRLTVGSFFNVHTPEFVMNGPRNPNIHQPRWLPFNGANVRGTIAGKESGWKYEAYYSILPELTTYNTHTFGGTLKYELDENRGHFTGTFARTQNERIADGVTQGLAAPLIPLPAVPFTGPNFPTESTDVWVDSRTGNPQTRTFVGPQAQNTWGLEVDYQIHKDSNFRIHGEYASSDYTPDRSLLFFDTSVSGDLLKFGLSAEPIDGLSLGLEYLSVDPTYDPFIAAYPISPGIPVFLPYGTYYSAYYQMHDYLAYPNNREGLKFTADYLFNDENTRVYGAYQSLDQKRASTAAQIQTVGNIEPLFPLIQTPLTAPKGRLDYLNLGVTHRWNVGLTTGLEYYHYDISRGAVAIDDVDIAQDAFKFTAEYPINEKWDVRANYYHLSNKGHSGLLNTDFTQSIPGVGVDWNFDQNGKLSVDYRMFDLRDSLLPVNSYEAGQLMVEMKLDF